MTHATTQYKAPRRSKTKTTSQPVGFLRRKDATQTGRSRNAKRQIKSSTNIHATNAFLRTAFLPKLEQPQKPLTFKDNQKTVRDFYKSLTILATQMAIKPLATKQYDYPFNMALALSDLNCQLGNKREDLVLVEHKNRVFFARQERFNTNQTLFYIPVEPLYLMLKNPQFRKGAILLLSVFSYLYKIADIPYYRQKSSYLYWTYERIVEMQMEAFEDEEEIDDRLLTELKKAAYLGDIIERKISKADNLKWFKTRLSSFKSHNKFETDCFELAKKYFELYDQYPYTTVYAKIPGRSQNDEDDVYTVGWENYISFLAKSTGRLADDVIDMVNCELQEFTHIDEPMIYQPIDGRKLKGQNFDFEKRLFGLMDALTLLLDNYK